MTPPHLVWEQASPLATVVSMVTGRVEEREEVESTGCSESVRWLEMLTDTFSLVCHLLISLLFSRRLSAQVLEYTHLDVYLPVFSQYKEPPVATLSLTCARAHAQTFYSWYMKSLSGRFLCHHGNPASGEQKLHLDCEGAHSASEQHVAQAPQPTAPTAACRNDADRNVLIFSEI